MEDYTPGPDVEQKAEEFAETLAVVLPKELGISEIIPGCVVTSMDYEGVGVTVVPRSIGVRIDDYIVGAMWRGTPVLAVGDECLVSHSREGETYDILTASGVHVSSVTDLYQHVWVFDVSANALLPYNTIVGAAGYAALAANDLILIPPDPPTAAATHAYDESVTLVSGVKFVQMVPGTVIIHSTSAAVAVTCVAGGYINVREIQVTNGSANIYAVYSNIAAGVCDVFAERIEATGDGTNAVYGVYHKNTGTLNVYTGENIEAHDGDGATEAIYSDAGTLNAYCKALILVSGGVGSWSIAADCEGGTQNVWAAELQAWDDDYCVGAEAAGAGTQTIRASRCYADTNGADAGDWAAGAECFNSNTVQIIRADCEAVAEDSANGIYQYRGDQYIHGNCFATVNDAAGTSIGAETGYGNQWVFGYALASGGATSYGAYCRSSGVQRVHGDATGGTYGAYCTGGTQTITCGRASGATFDLIRTGGTMQVWMVEYDSYSGTITSYYPLPGTGYIGEAGGATGRLAFDFTGGTDYANFASCHVGINEVAPGAMQQITIDNAATKGLLIKMAAGQAGYPFEIQTSAALTVAAFDASGHLGVRAAPNANYAIYVSASNGPTRGVSVFLQNNAVAGTYTGMRYDVRSTGGDGAQQFYGVDGVAYWNLNGAYAAGHLVIGLNGSIVVGANATGVINGNTSSAIKATVNHFSTGVCTLTYGTAIRVNTPTITGAGVITNSYGLYIENQNVATNNWAIYTNAGVNRLGDETLVTDGAGTAPDRLFHTEVSDAVTAAITYAERTTHITSGAAAALYGVGEEHELEDAAGNAQVASEQVTLWADATSNSESPLLRFTTYPKGSAGPGYAGFWTYPDVDNNAVTVIPGGAGDVTAILRVMYVVDESGGGTSAGEGTATPGGGALTIYTDGADTFDLTVAAGGAVTVVRSAGAATANIALQMVWI